MLSTRALPGLLLATFALAATSGCQNAPIEDNSIRPSWYAQQEFHLETRYKKVAVKTERGDATVHTDEDDAEIDTGDLADLWSEAVYWRYQVIHQGFVPSEDEDFYEYAFKGGKESPITVLKASLDPVLNIGGELGMANPKIYMVIREDRLRLAGLVYFYTVEGERLSHAITVDDGDMNRAYNLLSQSSLAIIPHFIPPFPIARDAKDVVLEDGQSVTFTNATETGIDVVYENTLDSTLIADCWEDGRPWSVLSSTPNMESRLLEVGEANELSGPMGRNFSEEEDLEDFDFIQRLKEAVNLNDTLYLDGLVGNHSFEVHADYRPWAGSWWPQSKGALVFGYHEDETDSLSEQNKAAFEEPATIVQNLGDELRTMQKNGDRDSDEWDTKLEEYQDAQKQLKGELSDFFSGIRAGIDGGQITLSEGRLVAEDNWNGAAEDADETAYPAFDLDINTLSPMEKFALLQHYNGQGQGQNPWDIMSWEMLNHWSPAGSSWWGHCNGWSAAAILTSEPRESVVVDFGNNGEHSIELTTADQKGLLSESFYSQLSNFYGARFNDDEGDDIADLSPRAVLQLLGTYIGQRGVPLVFDTSADAEVWNFPAWAYDIDLTETTGSETDAETPGDDSASDDTTDLVNINTAGPQELTILDGIDRSKADKIVSYREMNGPFQLIEDIMDVPDIDWDGGWFRTALFEKIRDFITVEIADTTRTFEGEVKVRFATDSVDYEHVDADITAPEGFTKTWAFTLEASQDGRLLSGVWHDEEGGHPDFAWVPYANTDYSGRSENPHLGYADLNSYLPGLARE